jgi:hypothetical protein
VFYLSTTVRNGLWPHTLWKCHKVIYKNPRDGDEFGAYKPSVIDPTLVIYPPLPSQRKIVVVPSDTTLQLLSYYAPQQKKEAMHAGQVAYTPYPQLDGENEITEIVCRNYPHPKRVAIEELSSDDKEVLESVSLYGSKWGDCLHDSSRAELTVAWCARAPVHPSRSYKEVGRAFRNAVARRAGTRPSLTKRGFRCHRLRA